MYLLCKSVSATLRRSCRASRLPSHVSHVRSSSFEWLRVSLPKGLSSGGSTGTASAPFGWTHDPVGDSLRTRAGGYSERSTVEAAFRRPWLLSAPNPSSSPPGLDPASERHSAARTRFVMDITAGSPARPPDSALHLQVTLASPFGQRGSSRWRPPGTARRVATDPPASGHRRLAFTPEENLTVGASRPSSSQSAFRRGQPVHGAVLFVGGPRHRRPRPDRPAASPEHCRRRGRQGTSPSSRSSFDAKSRVESFALLVRAS